MNVRLATASVAKDCERVLQVRTLAAAHPGPEFAETRRFDGALGDLALEVHPPRWSEDLPVLQLVEWLQPERGTA